MAKKKEDLPTNESIPIVEVTYTKIGRHEIYKSVVAISKEIARSTNRPYSLTGKNCAILVHTVKDGELKAMSVSRNLHYIDQSVVRELIDFING